ncbi:MAG: DUF4403 family protein [Saprospiraceae bacterium]|nr:DUF4403 family protein [Saprospiraceae bacterium]MCB9327888.1 DUF4403 family protein [Lewinellaceae bacterium]
MESNINLVLDSDKQSVLNYFSQLFDEKVGVQKFDVNGISVQLKRIDALDIIPDSNSVKLSLPLAMSLYKSAGIFSVEATGKLAMKLAVKFQILKNNVLSTETNIISWDWIEEPKIEIGSLDLPVEKLTNLALKHYEPVLTAKMDELIAQNLNLNDFLHTMLVKSNEVISASDWLGIKYKPTIYSIDIHDFQLQNGRYKLDAKVFGDIEVSDSFIGSSFVPEIRLFPDGNKEKSSLSISVDLHFDVIKNIILDQFSEIEIGGKPLNLTDIDIHYIGDKLNLEIDIDSPIKADLFLSGKPRFDSNNQSIDFDDLDVKVKASNILYKLTAPVIAGVIENRIKSMVPISVRELLQIANQKLSDTTREKTGEKINLSIEESRVEEIIIYNNMISLKIGAYEVEVMVNLLPS